METASDLTALRIFISSPGDLADERRKASQVIDQLQRWYGDAVHLQPVLWEDLPLEIDASFQNGIDVILSDDQGIDVAVFILWSRLGTPVTIGDRTYGSGTEREFDMMLQALEASGGERPDILFYRRDDDEGFDKRLTQVGDEEKLDLFTQKQLAKSFVQENFWDEEGQNTRAYHSFQQPVEFAGRFKVHLRQLIDKRIEASNGFREAQWTGAPYRGLETFHLEHADIFFGREEEVYRLETQLRRREAEEVDPCAFVAVVGASGSGKSSLVRAGLRANLVLNNLDQEIRAWRSCVLIPGQTEGKPLFGLVQVFSESEQAMQELANQGLTQMELANAFAESPTNTVRTVVKPALGRAAQVAGGMVKLLVVIDQFEELFTDTRITVEERDAYLLTLEALAKSGVCWVVVTIRSDLYQVAQQSETFLRLKGQIGETGQFDLLPVGPEALRRIITEPARMAGVRFEKRSQELGGQDLVARVLEDTQKQPDILPLLSDLLLELYKQRSSDNVLTFSAYEELGGLEGALSRRAEDVFSLLTPEQQATCPEILNSLVTVEPDSDAFSVRRRASLNSLRERPEKAALVESFIQARLLTAEGDEAQGDAMVSLAHEALMREWTRIADWVRDNRQHLRIRSRVEQAMHRWQEEDRHRSLLLSDGLDLQEGLSLLKEYPHLIEGRDNEDIRNYILRSYRRSRRRWARRLILLSGVWGGALLVSVIGLMMFIVGFAYFTGEERALQEFHRELIEQEGQIPKEPPPLDNPRQAQRPFHSFENRIGMEMVWCWPGTFTMGSSAAEPGRSENEVQHEVALDHGFWMARHEVTQAQWKKLMEGNPSMFSWDMNYPVFPISWEGAMTFCDQLTRLEGEAGALPEGWEYGLPTEAQWEYVCRAGSAAPFSGTTLGDCGWYIWNSSFHPHRVGSKQPNRWGFYDMHGNCMEWCLDWYQDDLSDPLADLQSPGRQNIRVLRGGSFDRSSRFCRSARRDLQFRSSRSLPAGIRPILRSVVASN